MDISIIIVSFNTKELLIDCLNSLIVAVKNFKSEIFVVDNNSHDNTVESVKRFFPEVKTVANSQNLGFSKANNQAIKKAKGKYIVILNPDTKVMPDAFKTMMRFMEQDPKIAVSTCRVELPNGELDRDCRRHFPTPWRAFFFFYGEDLDWCWRFKEVGYKIFYNPQAKIIHYKGAASGMKQTSKHLTKATVE